MNAFDYRRARSLVDAHEMTDDGGIPLAGGTDLVPLLQDGLYTAPAVVDIKHAGLPRGIRREGDDWVIGALTTLSDLELDEPLAADLPLLRQAAALSATRQLRNRATVGGNLLQASRCWYFRHPDLRCWLNGGETCFAKAGRHDRHALMPALPCITVHPSDLAGCLVALHSEVSLTSASGDRRVPLAEFLTVPDPAHRRLHDARKGELVTGVRIPAANGANSVYLKAMSRKAWSFALVGVAAVVTLNGAQRDERIERADVVLNGVAPIPMRLANTASPDTPLSVDQLIDSVCADFAARVEPLPRNAYKLPLAQALVDQALRQLTSSGLPENRKITRGNET